jgi:hypothetical protein
MDQRPDLCWNLSRILYYMYGPAREQLHDAGKFSLVPEFALFAGKAI